MAGFIDTIRGIFTRDQQAIQAAAGQADVGDIPVDMFGNLTAQAESHGMTQDYLSLSNALMGRFVDYERMDDYPDCSCLSADTIVRTLDGPVAIGELAKRGGSFHVFAVDIKWRWVVVAEAHAARRTAKRSEVKRLLRVELDNGQWVKCTPAHPFMMRDGSYREAQDLKPCDSLMPFDTKVWAGSGPRSGRMEAYQPLMDSGEGRRWQPVYQMVARAKYGDDYGPGAHAHHRNEDKLDDSWENIEVKSGYRHLSDHLSRRNASGEMPQPEWTQERRDAVSKRMKGKRHALGNRLSAETRRRMSDAHRGKPKSAEWRRKIGLSQPSRIEVDEAKLTAVCGQSYTVKQVADEMGWRWPKAKREIAKRGLSLTKSIRQRHAANHKVIRVVEVPPEDVFDLTVPHYHNFAIGAGIFVHNSALNIYADDSTVIDGQRQHVMWANSKDEAVRKAVDDMLHKKLRIDDEAWEFARVLCKYGNDHEEILVDPNQGGVVGLNFLPTPTIRRIEDDHGLLKGFVQSFRGNWHVSANAADSIKFKNGVGKDRQTGVIMFEPWRVVHMRLRSQRRRAMYGIGILEPARWVWRRLVLLEDAALISRLSRAPSRFAFYVDIGKLPSEKAEKYLDQIRLSMKKRKFVNPTTGKLDLRYNPLSTDEDFFLPVRESKEIVRADVLNTPTWTGVEDIDYFRNKLHAALMVPRAYLGYDENKPGRATLAQEDVRFGRSVLRIQKELRMGMRQVAKVHLASIGIDPGYVDFDIRMTVPSSIFELAQLEVQNTRAQFAQMMGELVSKHWILSKVFGLSDGEIEKVFQQRDEEARVVLAQQAISMGAGTPSGRMEGSSQFALGDPRVRNQLVLSASSARRANIEEDLFRGSNHAKEKRIEGKLESLLMGNRSIRAQLAHQQAFMNELKGALGRHR